MNPVALAEAYLGAAQVIAAAGASVEPLLTAALTLGAALGWPGE